MVALHRRTVRITAVAICAVAALGLLGAVKITGTSPGLPGTVTADAAEIKRGEYVARLADCAACHTALGGQVYAGGLKIASPIGTIFSTNITPDKAHGIGDYTLADFDRAIRQGVRKDGKTLYPAMPYPSFARLSDDDVKALYAFFEHGVTAASTPNQAEDIMWPLSMRWPLALWRGVFGPAVGSATGTVASAGSQDAILRRGEYLVTGAGHCGACHTPRGIAMQETALDGSKASFLAGGTVIDGWDVPNLRGDAATGLGRWSEDDIVDFLKTGRTDHAAVFGSMADVVAWSTQYYSDEDLHAVARYLKSLPADAAAPAPAASVMAVGGHGAEVYQQQCAICHRSDGGGVARMFPPLADNPVLASAHPTSLVKLILEGAALPPGNQAPSTVAMPAYADRLSDQDIADVTNYIRSTWGKGAKPNATAAAVAQQRKGYPLGKGGAASGWITMSPEPYGDGWTFAPQTHTGVDAAQ